MSEKKKSSIKIKEKTLEEPKVEFKSMVDELNMYRGSALNFKPVAEETVVVKNSPFGEQDVSFSFGNENHFKKRDDSIAQERSSSKYLPEEGVFRDPELDIKKQAEQHSNLKRDLLAQQEERLRDKEKKKREEREEDLRWIRDGVSYKPPSFVISNN